MFTRIRLEISDELVQRILHVHMSNFAPDFVVIIEDRFFLLRRSLFVREDVSNRVSRSSNELSGNNEKDCMRYSPVLATFFYFEKIVAHRLIGEFVKERSVKIHRSISDQENTSRPRRIDSRL